MSNSLPSSPVRTFQDYKIYADDDNNYTNGNLMIGEPMLNNNNNINSNRPIVHTMTSLSIGLSASDQTLVKYSSNRSIMNRTSNYPINKSLPYYDSNKAADARSLLHDNTIRNHDTTSYNNNNNNNNNNRNSNDNDNANNTTFATIGDNSNDPMLQNDSSSNNNNNKKNISKNNSSSSNNTNNSNINTSNVSPQNAIKKNNVNVLKTIQSSSRPLYNYVNNERINGMLNFDVSANYFCILSIFLTHTNMELFGFAHT